MPDSKLFALHLEDAVAKVDFADGARTLKSSYRTGNRSYCNRCLSLFLAMLLFALCGCVHKENISSSGTDPESTTVAGNQAPQESPDQENIEELIPEVTPESTLDHTAIHTMIDSISEKYGAVGVQVAIVHNGKIVGTYAYGWATLDTDPMTADHKIRAASISKVVIGITTMLLQEDGIIDIDADMGDYWGADVRNGSYPDTPITIRSILTHTSSLLS